MKSRYNTRQKDAIRQFLISHKDQSYTASEIYAALADTGISRTTVYRALSALEADGFCAKYPNVATLCDSYQYLEKMSCHRHIHYICSKCGKVGHLDCSFMDELREHVEGGHNFSIDSERSIIYGTCSTCKESEQKA